MKKWDELRTAYYLAKLGTVSATADALGLHRATVNRHVEALENEMGGKLFQRHARGYEPTEIGKDLLRVGAATEEQFADLAGRARGRANTVSGRIVLTSLEVVAPLVLPALATFRDRHPDTSIHYISSETLLNLAYGEAHVAIRAGPRPDHPDNVVQPYLTLRTGLYASRGYIEAHGLWQPGESTDGHGFVAMPDNQVTSRFSAWFRDNGVDTAVVFSATSLRIQRLAVETGLGMGFYPVQLAALNSNLVEIVSPQPEWEGQFWLVTHVDMHRTPNVQALLSVLKEQAA